MQHIFQHKIQELVNKNSKSNQSHKNGKEKKVRLDILGTNTAAERLYTGCGFRFVQAKDMFYEDTGWTEYKMYERVL